MSTKKVSVTTYDKRKAKDTGLTLVKETDVQLKLVSTMCSRYIGSQNTTRSVYDINRNITFNTGKVHIGLTHEKPKFYRFSGDELIIQSLILGDRFPNKYAVQDFCLYVTCLVALIVILSI